MIIEIKHLNSYSDSEISLNKSPPLCFIKPGFKLICSNSFDINFYNMKVKINKIIKTITKKYITDFCSEILKIEFNILSPLWCAC